MSRDMPTATTSSNWPSALRSRVILNAAYVDGDNSKVVPTDTMKNSVYGIARKHGVENIETFAQNLANHFHSSFDHVESATVSVVESLWQRIESRRQPPSSWLRGRR